MTTMTIDPDDPNGPALPVLGDEVRLHDGSTARVLRTYDAIDSRTMTGHDRAWQATGPQGARVISLDDIASYVVDEANKTDHAAALVLNAAINWENTVSNRVDSWHGTSMQTVFSATAALQEAIRAYMPLVGK